MTAGATHAPADRLAEHVQVDDSGSGTRARRRLSVAELQRALQSVRHLDRPEPAEPSDDPGVRFPARRGNPEADQNPADLDDQRKTRSSVGTRAQADGSARPQRSGSSWSIWSRLIGADLAEQLAAKRSRRKRRTDVNAGTSLAADVDEAAGPTPGPWSYVADRRTDSWPVVARRWAVLVVAVVVIAAGGLSIAARITDLIRPPTQGAAAPEVSDLQFAGAAESVALDLLSWDAAAGRDARAGVAARWGMPAAAVDGWDGSGKVTAAAAAAVGLVRTGDTTAVVTVQVRLQSAAWTGRWVFLAVPMVFRNGLPRVAAAPVLVGSPPTRGDGPAVTGAADEDTNAETATADTVGKLMAAYGAGDLEFARGPGTTFTGLAGTVTSGRVLSWRVAYQASGGDPQVRDGDVSVLWTLPGGTGAVRGNYRIQLLNSDGRWLLNAINPETEPLP